MVGSYGEVLVMDWGVARAAPENFLQPGGSGRVEPGPGAEPVPDGPTAHGAVLGTPGYMAPEQARGENERVDERADVYALGALLRFLLYHGAPAGDADHLPVSRTTHLLRALSGSPDRIPRQLDAIWRMAASPDPARRYDGAMLMSADVVRFMDGMPVAALPETVLDRAVRLFVRHRTAVLLLLTYLAIRMLLIFFGRP
jgi:serine/threonine-protein kinase